MAMLKRFALWTGGLLLGLAFLLTLAVGGAMVWLRSESGRAWLADKVAELTADSDTARVTVRGLGPGLPWRISIDELLVADRQGVWLRIENLLVRLSPADLLRQALRFEVISASELALQRIPESPEEPEEDKEPFSFSDLPEIRVEELDVARVLLGPELAGQAAAYSLHGKLATSQGVTTAALEARNLERAEDALVLDGRFDQPASTLSLVLQLDEARGGFLGRLLELPGKPDLRLALRGDGPLADWSGALDASAGDLFGLESTLTLSAQEPYRIDLQGNLHLAKGLLPAEAADILGTEAEFRLVGRNESGIVDFTGSGFRAQGLRAKLQGRLDPEQRNVDLTVEAFAPGLTSLAQRQGLQLEQTAPIRIHVQGPLEKPDVRLETQVQSLQAGEVRLKGANLVLSANRQEQESGPGGLEANLELSLDSLALPGGFDFRPLRLEAAAFTPDFKQIRLSRLAVQSPGLSLRGSGQADMDGSQGTADLALTVENLSRFAQLSGMPLKGGARLAAQVALAKNGVITAVLQGATANLAGLPEPLQSLTGPKVGLDARLAYGGREIGLKSLRVTGRELDLEAHGGTDLQDETFALVLSARVPELATVAKAAGLEAQGSLAANGHLKGRFSQFEAGLNVTSQRLAVQGQSISNLRLTADAHGLPEPAQMRLSLGADTPQGRLDAAMQASYNLEQSLARLRDARVSLPGLNVTSPELTMRTDSGLLSGNLQGKLESLQFVSALLSTPPGRLDAKGAFSLLLDAKQGKQAANLQGDFTGLAVNEIQVQEMHLQASLGDLFGTPQGRADIDIRKIQQGEMLVDSVNLAARGDLKRLTFSARTQGEFVHPFAARLQGLFERAPDGWSAILQSLRANVADTPIILRAPARLSSQGQGQEQSYALSDLSLGVAEGTISAQGAFGANEVSGRLRIESFPAELLPFVVPKPVSGNLRAELNLEGTPQDPRLNLDLRVREVRFPGMEQTPAVGLNAQTSYAQGRVQAQARLLGGNGMSGNIRAALPVRLSLQPFAFDAPQDGALTGAMNAKLDLTLLPPLLQWDDQLLSGTATADMNLSGTLGEPRLDGTLRMPDGRYQNLTSGTVLDKVRLVARASGQTITLEQLTATDGDGGRIKANGSAVLSEQVRYELKADLRHATMVRMREVTSTASGEISLRGNLDETTLGGRLTLERTSVSVPESQSTDIVDIEVKRINVPEALQERIEAQTSTGAGDSAMVMNLNMAIAIPNQFYVRGRGLDAEFSGNLQVGGTTESPKLLGSLDLVRGRFTILSATLTLREGVITFTGVAPPDPQFNVLATSTANDIEARVRVTGSADNLQLAFSSDPPLPEDEVLSRLLFGKSVGSLTPLQAIQLAQAVQQIRGGGGGPDIQGGFRRFLGLDELTVGEADASTGGGYTLEAGKYITDDVYLRLDKGITSEEDKVGVVIELTPSINLESEAGTTSGMGVGLFWKKDY
ncbi:translocation/assembly module TamB domain-containing protein [Desulfocurvibacter africanus]|uniref:Translocation and assembly module TamB C-terminal domain-containing protein n=1 Tax=Desulfocurvibacter africanus subsp. africanus str. Walvis Bay TaxID=690850 RepID=F3YZE0_DESAF|nr:translocation/assembly module TamB domain-containing protein [Desulfocurvibacter africanus]EGJ51969.1 protein of unknown function DUF490 [Desulfocurvibacter africanus subsp. africanus str. Walvis Bay]